MLWDFLSDSKKEHEAMGSPLLQILPKHLPSASPASMLAEMRSYGVLPSNIPHSSIHFFIIPVSPGRSILNGPSSHRQGPWGVHAPFPFIPEEDP